MDKVSLISDLQIKILAPEILFKSFLYRLSICYRDIFLLFDIIKVELLGIFSSLSFNIILFYLPDKTPPILQTFVDNTLPKK